MAQKEITEFCSYFEQHIASIRNLSIRSDAGLHSEVSIATLQKVLYVSVLDTLAGLRYQHRGNRERFQAFVLQHAGWKEAELLSIPFLWDELESKNRCGGALGKAVALKIGQHSTEDGGFPAAKHIDEPASRLMALAADSTEIEAIEKCRHVELLYRYRNFLVHESREPGNSMDVSSAADPHYTTYLGDSRWYLVYPLRCFESLVSRSIDSFRAYLVAESIDPYGLFGMTERW